MTVFSNEFIQKAHGFQKPLKERKICPTAIAEISKDAGAFQGLKAAATETFRLPFVLNSGDKVLLDFGDHCVGYLHFTLSQPKECRIADSPVKLRFSFGEFPLEIVTQPDAYQGTLGNGWLQNEEKAIAFMPYSGSLERRYAFRYLLIERKDNARFPIEIADLFASCVSAVDLSDAEPLQINDQTLQKIYDISLKTLRECEQDVFEDGPKRDRRLWIGDLRLQALTDYVTFRNIDLIKRCLYLFAAYRTDQKKVAPCVFPDSPPYVDNWTFADYSLFFISCLHDYMEHGDDLSLVEELYPVALEQAQIISSEFDSDKGIIEANAFIDWCPALDKSVALLGVYVYTLKQLKKIAFRLGKPCQWIESETQKIKTALLGFRSEETGLFVTASGQLSWHSQVWAVLSGVLTEQQSIRLLESIGQAKSEFVMHTPYMIHYYIEALDCCGLKERAIETIKDYWGKIVKCGFDCCPEVFNPENEFESPYRAPEINSACHAWSCTPAYWLHQFCSP